MVHYIDKSPYAKKRKGFNETRENQPKQGLLAKKFTEFCKRTDLHGYKYIVMKDLNIFERSCWALAVLASTAVAVYFVITAYNWYARNPIVTVIESTQGAIWDIPFPAVTICNLNVISKKAARQFADKMELPANTTADEVFAALKLTPFLHSNYVSTQEQKEVLYKLQAVLELNSVTIENMFRKLSPASSCNQLVQRCMWKNTIYRCDTLFQQVYTYFAICCSFNYFANNMNKSPEEMQDQLDMPRRVASCGYQTALTVLVDSKPDDYYSALIASQGAMVFIDNAFNIADMDSPVRLVNPATEVLIALSPERTYTTPGIRAFKPADRQCYYSDEVEIGNFRQYSFHNCMAYLRVEYIKSVCDCVPFYFPSKGEYKALCITRKKVQCLTRVIHHSFASGLKLHTHYHRTCNFYDMECLDARIAQHVNGTHLEELQNIIECLPECEHYDYPLEVALGKLANNVRLDGLPFFSDVRLDNRSLVNVFFNDLVSTRYRRDVYLNWQNLLASFGGLLSLMLGFTLISGFDLVLFFTFGMVYGSIIDSNNPQDDDRKNKLHKGNKIYVQEHDKQMDNFVTKNIGGKEMGKWRSEMKYGVNNIKY